MDDVLGTGAAALLFATAFLAGGLRLPGVGGRSTVAFGSGMSVAYVFVRVMPELHEIRHAFASSVGRALQFEGAAIYFVALLGFLLFYGLEHLRQRLFETASDEEDRRAFRLHVAGFAAYVLLVSYVLTRTLTTLPKDPALYALAVAVHFRAVDYSLALEHGRAYERVGRFVLGGMALVGWGSGMLLVVPRHVVALLMAFVSGSVIMNSAIMELASAERGRFWAFLAGGLLYGAILVPLG